PDRRLARRAPAAQLRPDGGLPDHLLQARAGARRHGRRAHVGRRTRQIELPLPPRHDRPRQRRGRRRDGNRRRLRRSRAPEGDAGLARAPRQGRGLLAASSRRARGMTPARDGAREIARDEETYSIAELAREFDLTTRAIRFYEDEGLLAPRRRGQMRIYSPRDRTRLKLILRGKRLGFSLQEIAEMVTMYDATPGEAGQLDLFLKRIAERRATLEQQREDIKVTLSELEAAEAAAKKRL